LPVESFFQSTCKLKFASFLSVLMLFCPSLALIGLDHVGINKPI
jgi:hypothetical protein